MRRPSPVGPTLFLTSALVLFACGDDAHDWSKSSGTSLVGPSRVPLAIPGTVSEDGEALTGALDPYSLPADFHADGGPLTPSTTTLPVDETYGGGAGWAFKITQAGSGNAGWFRVTSPSSANRMALLASHLGDGIAARAINSGRGRALWAQIPEPSNPFDALVATNVGKGSAMYGLNVGTGPAGRFEIRNGSNDATALEVESDGEGPVATFTMDNPSAATNVVRITSNSGATSSTPAVFVSTNGTFANGFWSSVTGSGGGAAGIFQVNNAASFGRAISASTQGTGTPVWVIVGNNASNAAAIIVNNVGNGPMLSLRKGITNTVAAVGNDGEFFSDVGYSTPAADVAESFAPEGSLLRYEPGDVLVISTKSDRRVEKSAEPYSTLVAGVYASRPGVRLGHGRPGAGTELPVGVVGVIPTKVSAENGTIRRGDLLVTGTRPGHAMRADPGRVGIGQVLGKALAPFDGPGTGLIEVLVSVE